MSLFDQCQFKMPKKATPYKCPVHRLKKDRFAHPRMLVSTRHGGFGSVPNVKDLRIKAAVKENTKQCIVLGRDLQAVKNAEPFVQEDFLKQVDEVKKLLKV